MTPKGLKWEVKDVPAAPEVWELAKKNFLADKWWRGPDHPDTPEGDQKYIEFYESPSTMEGEVDVQGGSEIKSAPHSMQRRIHHMAALRFGRVG